jgi:hypothetical protein
VIWKLANASEPWERFGRDTLVLICALSRTLLPMGSGIRETGNLGESRCLHHRTEGN